MYDLGGAYTISNAMPNGFLPPCVANQRQNARLRHCQMCTEFASFPVGRMVMI